MMLEGVLNCDGAPAPDRDPQEDWLEGACRSGDKRKPQPDWRVDLGKQTMQMGLTRGGANQMPTVWLMPLDTLGLQRIS